MQRVTIELEDDELDGIREMIEQDEYDSAQSFVRSAIQNELDRAYERRRESTAPTLDEALGFADTGSTPREGSRASSRESSPESEIPSKLDDAKSALQNRQFSVETHAPPNPDRLDDGPLWGQYNRLFPVKIVVRRLANELHERSGGVPYDEFREETARTARVIGKQIDRYDERKGRSRGDKLATALPTGDKIDRSLGRFKTHFVGQQDSEGHLTGAAPDLRFLDITTDDETFQLTDAGLGFAELENPLLDGELSNDTSLSEAEREFLVDHIRTEIPAEWHAVQRVAQAITDGIDRPTELDETVGDIDDSWSDAQAETVRSGLVSRLHELGLVARERVGARGIRYVLTDTGRRHLLGD